MRKDVRQVCGEAELPIELRRGAPERVAMWVMGATVAMLPLLFVFCGWIILADGEGMGALMLIFALPFAYLTYFCFREAAARSSVSVRIEGQGLKLLLPAQRSYVAQERIDELLGLSAIKAIETRVEAFLGAGNTITQQSYAIVLNNGRRIVLGGDRRMLAPYFGEVADALAQATGKPITDLGVVDANAGFLMFAGQSVPPWDAAPLSQAMGEKRVRDEQSAWRIASIVLAVAGFVILIARLFMT